MGSGANGHQAPTAKSYGIRHHAFAPPQTMKIGGWPAGRRRSQGPRRHSRFSERIDSAVIVFGHEWHELSRIFAFNSNKFVPFVTKNDDG
jgi:hypothetical protein